MMTIDSQSIPLQNFSPENTSMTNLFHESDDLIDEEKEVKKRYSLPNFLNNIGTLTQKISFMRLYNQINSNTRQLNLELSFFLANQNKKVHQFKDINDVDEMMKCTQAMKESLAHIKFTDETSKLYEQLNQSLESKKYELKCQKILSNLDETLVVFNDDFLSRSLRREMHYMLSQVTDIHDNIIDIFFFGTYSLADQYQNRKFRKEVYSSPGKEIFQREIQNYVDSITAKIMELNEIKHTLSKYYFFGKQQIQAIDRVEAVISILCRPVSMMEGLKAATNEKIHTAQEKALAEKKQKENHCIYELTYSIEELPEIEDLRNLLKDL